MEHSANGQLFSTFGFAPYGVNWNGSWISHCLLAFNIYAIPLKPPPRSRSQPAPLSASRLSKLPIPPVTYTQNQWLLRKGSRSKYSPKNQTAPSPSTGQYCYSGSVPRMVHGPSAVTHLPSQAHSPSPAALGRAPPETPGQSRGAAWQRRSLEWRGTRCAGGSLGVVPGERLRTALPAILWMRCWRSVLGIWRRHENGGGTSQEASGVVGWCRRRGRRRRKRQSSA